MVAMTSAVCIVPSVTISQACYGGMLTLVNRSGVTRGVITPIRGDFYQICDFLGKFGDDFLLRQPLQYFDLSHFSPL